MLQSILEAPIAKKKVSKLEELKTTDEPNFGFLSLALVISSYSTYASNQLLEKTRVFPLHIPAPCHVTRGPHAYHQTAN